MALTITDTEITSTIITVHAEYRRNAAANGYGAWVIFGQDHHGDTQTKRLLTKEQAVEAMQALEARWAPE